MSSHLNTPSSISALISEKVSHQEETSQLRLKFNCGEPPQQARSPRFKARHPRMKMRKSWILPCVNLISSVCSTSAPHSFLKTSQPVFAFPLYWIITKNVISHFLQAMFLEHVPLTPVLPRDLRKLSINSSCFPGSLYQPQPFPSQRSQLLSPYPRCY